VRTTIEVTVEVEIERPPSAVWELVAEVERLPEWIVEFKAARCESEEPIGVGTVVRYTLQSGNRSGTYEIVEWDPPRRMAWDGPPLRWAGGGARPRGVHALAEAGPGRTLLVSRYRPELTGTHVLLKPYLGRWLRRERFASAQNLKALLEAGPALQRQLRSG
jgi:uncharacterized protein YndB with AHSA1/START domain